LPADQPSRAVQTPLPIGQRSLENQAARAAQIAVTADLATSTAAQGMLAQEATEVVTATAGAKTHQPLAAPMSCWARPKEWGPGAHMFKSARVL